MGPSHIYKIFDREEFYKTVMNMRWTRQIYEVHMHHTWKPNHGDWKGKSSQYGMWNYHTNTMGWGDIAQNITIDPEGIIWNGRNWNRTPVSSAGRSTGSFMYEMVGNFDHGNDILDGIQLGSSLFVTCCIQKRFNLDLTSLKFHRHLGSPKTCPGTSVDYEEILGQLESFRDYNFRHFVERFDN